MPTEQTQSGHEARREARDPSKPRAVFLFVACPDEVLGNFEKAVHERGVGGDVEPIAVSGYPSPEYLKAFLDENRDDVVCVVIDLRDADVGQELIVLTAEIAPKALILGTDDGKRSDPLLSVLRAGARDVIAPPYDMKTAAELVSVPARPVAEGLGKLACFLPSQGGAGASTSAIHFASCVAAELAASGEHEGPASPTLLLDLDFHSDSAAFWLNKRPAYTLTDVLEGAVASPAYWRKVTACWNGVDLLAPPPPDRYVSEKLLRALPSVVEAARKVYPWVIADLPPTLFASSRELLPMADLVFLVCTPESRALYLAKRRLTDLGRLGVPEGAVRVTLNRAGAKRSIEAATAEKAIGVEVSFSVDNDYVEISSAYADRRLASPTSAPGRQFKSMARVALGVQEQMAEKTSGWRRLVGLG